MEYDPEKIERDRMTPFVNWWRLDDPKWVAQREDDWRFLEGTYLSESTIEDKAIFKRYFLTGEKKTYIPKNELFLMTPIVDKDQAREFFYSENYTASDRQILTSSFLNFTEDESVLLRYKKLIKSFVFGVLGEEYHILEDDNQGCRVVISPEPTLWSGSFIHNAIRVLKGKVQYHGVMETINYFVSVLPHANDADFRPTKKFNKFLAAIDEALENESLSDDAKRFAQELKSKEDQIKEAYALNAHLDG